jgi:hypothetical protein
MTTILGNDVHCFLDGTEVFCAKDCVLTETKDTVEMAGGAALSGKWIYNRLVRRSWKVDCSGLTKVDSSDGQLDYFSIVADPFATDFHVLVITWDDVDGNNVTFTGNVFIPKSSIGGQVSDFAPASVSFLGTGPYELSTETSGSGSGTPCVPVAAGGTFAPVDGVLNSPYSYTFNLTGTSPKTLGAFSGNPAWMTLSVASGNLVLGGTPTSFSNVGTFFLDIIVNNACGSVHLIDEVGAEILEDGRNVFVINNSSSSITLTNSNGHSYTFGPSNANDGNIKMQTSSVHIVTVSGTKNYEFLQTLPSTVINSGTFSSGNNLTTSNFSNTNYLRFS